MTDDDKKLIPVRAAYENLAKAIKASGPWSRAKISKVSLASHLSQREVEDLLKESGNANTPDNVIRAVKQLRFGEMIAFADLAESLGNPRRDGIGLASVVKTDAVPPSVAARIIATNAIKGSLIKLDKDMFISQSTTPRSEHLRAAEVPFEVEGDLLIVPVSTLVTGRELKKRLTEEAAS